MAQRAALTVSQHCLLIIKYKYVLRRTVGSKAKKIVSRLQDRFNGDIECEKPQPSLGGAFKAMKKIVSKELCVTLSVSPADLQQIKAIERPVVRPFVEAQLWIFVLPVSTPLSVSREFRRPILALAKDLLMQLVV